MTRFLGEINAANEDRFSVVHKNRYWTLRAQLQRQYNVLSDDLTQTSTDIIENTPELPRLLQKLQGVKCVEVTAEEDERVSFNGTDRILWLVTAKFDTDTGEGTGGGNDDEGEDQPPTERAVKTRWYGENEQEQMFFDRVDRKVPVTTVVGEFIYLEHPVVRPILEIQRIEYAPFNPFIQLAFANRVNSSLFFGAPRGCALMMPMVTRELVIESYLYIEVTYTIKFAMREDPDNPGTFLEDQWKAEPLHEGNYCKDENNEINRCVDPKGRPTRALLEQDGSQVFDVQDYLANTAEEDIYLSFNRYQYADFNLLQL